VFTFEQLSAFVPFYTERDSFGGSMKNDKRDWHQIAAQLRSETDLDKVLSLALQLEDMRKGGTGPEDDSSHSPRTQARAKWGQGPNL
jgi:hypothetical protein